MHSAWKKVIGKDGWVEADYGIDYNPKIVRGNSFKQL